MAERPTGGYNLEFDDDGIVGIIQEFENATEGDTQDISGMGVVQNGLIRRKGVPVDVGETLTVSGILDDTAPGYENFHAAMKNRTRDVVLKFLREGNGHAYTGHAESYNETASRSNGVWNFSLTFYVNETEEVTAA